MEIIQEFALKNIHCSPSEDRQFRFELVRLTAPDKPVRRRFHLYDREVITLPDDEHRYHLYDIGGIPSTMLNLVGGPQCMGNGTDWINVEDDMNERHYIFQMYDDKGVNLPRAFIYYRITKHNHLVFAVKVDLQYKGLFNIDDFKYIRVYSNPYYDNATDPDVINIKSFLIETHADRIRIRRWIEQLPQKGKLFYYYNGYFSDTFNNNAPIRTMVEVFQDTGIVTMERFEIDKLRTFNSITDKRAKYLIYRDVRFDHIQYEDDLEIYVTAQDKEYGTRGLYYYQNKNQSLRNVTDKDYSIDVEYVNYHAAVLANEYDTHLQYNEVIVITREPMHRRDLVFSNLKIHELYKLPSRLEYNVMLNNGFSIEDFRVETLEDSPYWVVAGLTDLSKLSPELAMDATGYSAASYYYGNTPMRMAENGHMDTPFLYAYGAHSFEYDEDGVLRFPVRHVEGSIYTPMDEETKWVELVVSRDKNAGKLVALDYGKHSYDVVDNIKDITFIAASHDENGKRIEEWKNITDSEFITYHEDGFEIHGENLEPGIVFAISNANNVTRSFTRELTEYSSGFYVTQEKVIDSIGYKEHIPMDYYPRFFEIFLNGHRLIHGLDYFMDFPFINICNKEYMDFTNVEQLITYRYSGHVDDVEDMNMTEVKGFVNHGVLARNNYYDIRDDRVFTAWVGGKLIDREDIIFAEDDNSLRVDHKLNGRPYVIADKLIDLEPVSGLTTMKYYKESLERNQRISRLYNTIYPEPKINQFNVSTHRHLLYSPLVATIIEDLLTGYIHQDVYTREYQPQVIRDFLDENYRDLLRLDPIMQGLPEDMIEIHPHYANTPITVNVFQYRFVYNMIKTLTNGNNRLVELSSRLMVNDDAEKVSKDIIYDLGYGQGLTPFD